MSRTLIFPIPPERQPAAERLLKRIGRAAAARKLQFEWSFGQPAIKNYGPAYATAQSYPDGFPQKGPKKAHLKRQSVKPKDGGNPLYPTRPPRTQNPEWDDWVIRGRPESTKEPPETCTVEGAFIRRPPDWPPWLKIAAGSKSLTKKQLKACHWVRYEQTLTIHHDFFGDSDWEVIATVEPLGTGKRARCITLPLPSISDDGDIALMKKRPKTFPGTCDHCSTKRRRNDLVAVMHKKRKWVRFVGRTCLFEYTNIDPKLVERLFNMERYAEAPDAFGEGGRGGHTRPTEPLARFLEIVCSYFSVRGAYQKGTGSRFLKARLMRGHKYNFVMGQSPAKWDYEWWTGFYDKHGGGWVVDSQLDLEGSEGLPGDGTREIVNGIMHFMENHFAGGSKDRRPRSSYEQNLLAIWESGVVNSKSANFAASVYSCYMRWVEKEIAKRNAAGDSAGEQPSHTVAYPAEPGTRIIDVEAQVTMARGYESMYGAGTIILMTTPKGNIKWFASARNTPRLGDKIKIKGAFVKKKDSFKGDESLIVNRVKWEVIE